MTFIPPTEPETGVVDVLKSQMISEVPELASNKNFSSTTVLRFYRGQKANASSALDSLKKYIHWRYAEDVDNIENRKADFQRELDGKKVVVGLRDLQGRPAAYVFAHRHNAYDRNVNEVKMLTTWTLESLRKAANPEEERYVIAVDLGKFTMRCMDYEALKCQVDILQSHYPETLESCYIIDSPFFFSACWRIIRPWLDPVTAKKVNFIKRADLALHFDVANIPREEE